MRPFLFLPRRASKPMTILGKTVATILPFQRQPELLPLRVAVIFLNEASAKNRCQTVIPRRAARSTAGKGGQVMELSKWRKAGTRLSAAVIMAFAMAACSDTPKPESELGQGGRQSPATPGSARDFAVNVGDIVYFTTDS